jgi:hypothetical protein
MRKTSRFGKYPITEVHFLENIEIVYVICSILKQKGNYYNMHNGNVWIFK